jgi:hypothetical protein
MQSVDGRGHGPDRKAIQLEEDARRRRNERGRWSEEAAVGEAGCLRCSACGRRASAVTSSRSALSGAFGGSVSSVCEAWLARGEKRCRRGSSCATKSRRREAPAGVAAGRQGKCKRACTGLDWAVRGHGGLVFSSLLTRARQTRRWYWRREGGRREGWVRSQRGECRRGRELGIGRWSSGGGRAGQE